MAETPDFDQIANAIPGVIPGLQVSAIKAALMDIWNARGAADIVQLEAELPGAYIKVLDRALRKLDR